MSSRSSAPLWALGWSFLGVLAGLGLSRAFVVPLSAHEPPATPATSTTADSEPEEPRISQPPPLPESDRLAELEAELFTLRERLAESERARVEREEEFLAYTEMITGLVPKEAPPEILEALAGEVPESSLPQEDPRVAAERAARRARAEEMALALRSLMRVEHFDSLDLLEVGSLDAGALGPVVFRVLDERGRPVGSLAADRLRLEGSRSGWTLTFVLEDGYERRDGARLPFEGTLPGEERGGERRIVLANTDPGPWFEALPELFAAGGPAPLLDDGRWHLMLVRSRLNELLAADAAHGSYRLVRLGGVFDDVLRDVVLEELGRGGHRLRRLVADRLEIADTERGVELTLRDGVILDGAQKHAFLDGRYRIYLPRAEREAWRAAGLPGLVSSEESSAGSGAPLGLR